MKAIVAGMLGVGLLVVLAAGCNKPQEEPVVTAPPQPAQYPEAQVPRAEPQPLAAVAEEPELEPPPAVDTEAKAAPKARSSAKQAPKDRYAPAKKSPRTYTVKKGDTLQKISQKFYGTTKNWRKIHQANRNTIKDPDVLVEGKKIIIP